MDATTQDDGDVEQGSDRPADRVRRTVVIEYDREDDRHIGGELTTFENRVKRRSKGETVVETKDREIVKEVKE